MSVYENLDLLIRENIKQNNAQQITGVILQETLLEMVETLGQPEDILWSDLLDLKTAKGLVPGRLYRITDYITTTKQVNTRSTGHPFDVIVLAVSASELSERAWACHSGRDIDDYFSDSKLEGWQILYCLDNDPSRFSWVDPENGKGVIYRMIDEYNNDCPYDFKNIQFRHPSDSTKYPDYYYTFSTLINGVVDDHSLNGEHCYGNKIGLRITAVKQQLNNIVFINTAKTSSCHSNRFGNYCTSNSFGSDCHSNSFGRDCYANSFGHECRLNIFGNACHSNSFGAGFRFNIFGNICTSNRFGNECRSNIFGNECSTNIFGNTCFSNYFGNDCRSNSFGNFCRYNSFGNCCYENSFGNYFRYNMADDGVSVTLNNSQTASANQSVQNYHLTRGLASKTIDVERNRAYQTTVAIDSSGNVKQFCIADTIQ